MRKLGLVLGLLALALMGAFSETLYPGGNMNAEQLPGNSDRPPHLQGIDPAAVDWRAKSEDFWRSVLSSEQVAICRGAGTERPFTGKYCKTHSDGDFYCVCCGQLLFRGGAKFDSGTGWPSFSEAGVEGALRYVEDPSHGMTRTEVRCSRCDAHLGHVFDDGPPPSGKRYCINSVCLFKE